MFAAFYKLPITITVLNDVYSKTIHLLFTTMPTLVHMAFTVLGPVQVVFTQSAKVLCIGEGKVLLKNPFELLNSDMLAKKSKNDSAKLTGKASEHQTTWSIKLNAEVALCFLFLCFLVVVFPEAHMS